MKNQERSALILEVVPLLMRWIRAEMRGQGTGRTSLTVPQYRVLSHVLREPASNQELAEWMGVSEPTMSKMVDTLIRRRMLTRKPGVEDRRQVRLECSAQGAALAQEVRRSVQGSLAQRIAGVSEEKLQAIEIGLIAIKETLL